MANDVVPWQEYDEAVRLGRRRSKGRDVILTRFDEAVLTEALTQTFPTVAFAESPPGVQDQLRQVAALCEAETSVVHIYVHEDPAWQPVVDPNVPISYLLPELPTRRLFLCRSRWIWQLGYVPADDDRFAFDPPTLGEGSISALWIGDDPRYALVPAFLRGVWRILARLTTNKLKGGAPLTNILHRGTDRLLMAEAGARAVWVGHHALEWCAAGGARRMLDGKWRPCDDWAPPGNVWYQRLRRRVEERYGPGFGLPPAEPPQGKIASI